MRNFGVILILFGAALWASAGEGDEDIHGFSGLYMGHSFFVPSARELKVIAALTTIEGHEQVLVGAGGAGGSPRKLWEADDRRALAQAALDTKTIDLLVMTYYSEKDSAVDDYSRWFDYAIAQNPEVTFMVAVPWPKELRENDDAKLKGAKAMVAKLFDDLIVPLRAKYPKNTILYCPYGLGVSELITRYKAEELPGVDCWQCEGKDVVSLFRDPLGHPNALIAQVGALLWLQTLYDYDISTLDLPPLRGLPDLDVKEIAIAAHKNIAPYNVIYRQAKP